MSWFRSPRASFSGHQPCSQWPACPLRSLDSSELHGQETRGAAPAWRHPAAAAVRIVRSPAARRAVPAGPAGGAPLAGRAGRRAGPRACRVRALPVVAASAQGASVSAPVAGIFDRRHLPAPAPGREPRASPGRPRTALRRLDTSRRPVPPLSVPAARRRAFPADGVVGGGEAAQAEGVGHRAALAGPARPARGWPRCRAGRPPPPPARCSHRPPCFALEGQHRPPQAVTVTRALRG